MAYHERDLAEELHALSVRFREHEFTEEVYHASLFAKGVRGPDIEEIIYADLIIRQQFAGSNARVLPTQCARNIATVIKSLPEGK